MNCSRRTSARVPLARARAAEVVSRPATGKTRRTHNKTSLLDISGKLGILRQKSVAFGIVSLETFFSDTTSVPRQYRERCLLTRVNHLRAVLLCDFDDLVACEISSDRGVLASLANDVGLVRLCSVSP